MLLIAVNSLHSFICKQPVVMHTTGCKQPVVFITPYMYGVSYIIILIVLLQLIHLSTRLLCPQRVKDKMPQRNLLKFCESLREILRKHGVVVVEDTRPLSRVSSSLSTDRAPSRSSVESDSMHGLFATSSKRRNLTTRTNDTFLEQADDDDEDELEAGRLRLFAGSECAPTDEEMSVAGDDREDGESVAAGSVTARTSQINATVRDDRFGPIPHFDDLTIHEESSSSSSAQDLRKKKQQKSAVAAAAAAAIPPQFQGDSSLNTSTSAPRKVRGRPHKRPPSDSKQQRRNEDEPADEELNESTSGDSSIASGSRDRRRKSARRSAQKQPAARQRSSSRESSPSAHNTSLNSSAYNLRERLNTSRASADTSGSSDLNRSTRSSASNAPGGNRRNSPARSGGAQQQPGSSLSRRADPSDRRMMDTSRHQKHR